MTSIRATCHTEGCGVVRGFSFDMDGAEARRLQRKVLAVAGWLTLGDSTYCVECTRMFRIALPRMNADQRRAIQSALADALFMGRCEIVGV